MPDRALPVSAPSLKPSRTRGRLSPFQRALHRRLTGGSFRQLNELLYTSTSQTAHSLLRSDPSLFDTYHAGFSSQTRRWPRHPLDRIIRYLNTLSTDLRVADMGCGEARLAREVKQRNVCSFDLVARGQDVTECDIRCTPVDKGSMDVVVYCLALMGTNYGEFLEEGARVVKMGGRVIVAEVKSRFAENGEIQLVNALEERGLKREIVKELDDNVKGKGRKRGGRKKKGKDMKQLFVVFVFRKVAEWNKSHNHKTQLPILAPCVYKKR